MRLCDFLYDGYPSLLRPFSASNYHCDVFTMCAVAAFVHHFASFLFLALRARRLFLSILQSATAIDLLVTLSAKGTVTS